MDINTMFTSTIHEITSNYKPQDSHRGEVHIRTANDDVRGREASEKEIRGVLDVLNKAAMNVDSRVSFTYDDKVDRVIMRVVNPENNEVVRQIPSKEMVRLLERIHEMSGMFVDEKG